MKGKRAMKKLVAVLVLGVIILSGCSATQKASETKKDNISVAQKKADSSTKAKESKDNKDQNVTASEAQKKVEDKQGTDGTKSQENKKDVNIASEKVASASASSKNVAETNKPNQSASQQKPSVSASAPKPAPAPTPAPKPAPVPTQPVGVGDPTVRAIQNSLPSGYIARAGDSSYEIVRGSTVVAYVLQNIVEIYSLNSADINASLKGASALGGNYSNMNSVVQALLSGKGPILTINGVEGYKKGDKIMLTW